jgi:hypothetical protein
MNPKIAIVGSKSLEGMDSVYEIIDDIMIQETKELGNFILINGGEEGVDTMAGEIALSCDIDYEIVPLKECPEGCNSGKLGQQQQKYCFAHSYESRSKEIAREADVIYRIYDEGCGTSTCQVTAKFGDEFGKKVVRIPIYLLSIGR